jgi:hypothetical protein
MRIQYNRSRAAMTDGMSQILSTQIPSPPSFKSCSWPVNLPAQYLACPPEGPDRFDDYKSAIEQRTLERFETVRCYKRSSEFDW